MSEKFNEYGRFQPFPIFPLFFICKSSIVFHVKNTLCIWAAHTAGIGTCRQTSFRWNQLRSHERSSGSWNFKERPRGKAMRGPDRFHGGLLWVSNPARLEKDFVCHYLSSDNLRRLLVGCNNKWACALVLPWPIRQKTLVPPWPTRQVLKTLASSRV